MPVPVAGRRKGVPSVPETGSYTSAPADALGGLDAPSWLDDLSNDTPRTNMGGAATASSSNFLSARSQPPGARPNEAGRRENASAGVPSFLGESTEPVRTPSSAGTGVVLSRNAAPAFLFDDNGINADIAPDRGNTGTVSAAAASALHGEDETAAQRRALKDELRRLEHETESSQRTITALESGQHELCKGVENLKTEHNALLAKERDAIAVREEAQRSAEAQRASLGERQSDAMAEAITAIRGELEQQHVETLVKWQKDVAAQEGALASARKAVEEMQRSVGDDTSENRTHAMALTRLQAALTTMMRSSRGELAMQMKHVLSKSFREQMSEAAKQRDDIFASDRAERASTLDSFLQKQREARLMFAKEQTEAMRRKRDDVFGALRQRLRADLDAHSREKAQRLSTYRAQVAENVQAVRATTEQSIAHLNEAAARTVSDAEAKYELELKSARDHHQSQLQLFRRRAEAEMCNVTTAAQQHQSDPSTMDSLSGGRDGLGALQLSMESIRQCLDQMRTRANAEAVALQRRCQHPDSRQRSIGLRAQRNQAETEQAMHTSSHELTVTLQRFHDGVVVSQESVRGWQKTLQEKRVRLATLHGGVETVRRKWEYDIRAALSGALTSTSFEADDSVPLKENYVTEAVESLTKSLCAAQQRRQQVRGTRHALYERLEEQYIKLERQRDPVDAAMRAVFNTYEKLNTTSSTLEGLQRALELANGDAAAARRQLTQDQVALAAQQERLGQLAAKLQDDSRRLQKEEARLCRRQERQVAEEEQLRVALMSSTVPYLGEPLAEEDSNQQQRSPGKASTRTATKVDAFASVETARKSAKTSPSPVVPSLGVGHSHPNRRQSLYHYLAQGPVNAVGSGGGSPHSSFHTASEFSTELVPLDDDSMDEIAALQAALGLNSGLIGMAYPAMQASHFSSGIGDGKQLSYAESTNPPLADTTKFGCSLTTPTTSSDSRKR